MSVVVEDTGIEPAVDILPSKIGEGEDAALFALQEVVVGEVAAAFPDVALIVLDVEGNHLGREQDVVLDEELENVDINRFEPVDPSNHSTF